MELHRYQYLISCNNISRKGICNFFQGVNLRRFVGTTYVSTQVGLFESKIRCQNFTLLLMASHCFLINPLIAAHTLPPHYLISNYHSIKYPHNLSPLNDYGSHGSIIFPPSMMMAPMSPMSPHSVPLNDNGSHGSLQYVPPQ